LNALEEFNFQKGREITSNNQIQKFVENSVALLQEMFANNLRNRSKQRRDFCRLYNSINIFAHDAYTLDDTLYSKGEDRPHVIFLWVLDMALRMMVKQLLLGFELGLYSQHEYAVIFFLLGNVFTFLERNFKAVLTKYDREFLMAWQTKQNLEKKKRRLTDFQKKFFYESMYYKCVENYCNAMFKLTYLTVSKGIIPGEPSTDMLKNRYYQRLKIFDNIFFLKKPEFEEYQQILQAIDAKPVAEHYKDVKQAIDTTVKLLAEINSEEALDSRLKSDCEKLKRICVKNSLAMMMISTNKNDCKDLKATFKNDEHSLFPVLELSKKA